MKNKLKIFLTGGNGFIGKNILEQLGDKYEFLAPRSAELDLTNSDQVSNFLAEHKPDLVIHAANLGGKRKDKNIENLAFLNLQMFFNIIRNRKYFSRLIMLGSGAEYDRRSDIKEVKEEDFDNKIPADQYGFYKYVCSKYSEQVDFITYLRIFGIYGKYEDYSVRFISNNICRVLLGLPVSINQNANFEFIYIDDFIKILDYFVNHKGREKFYNIGSGCKDSLLDIGHKISDKSGQDTPIFIKQEGLNKEYTCNIDRLKREIPDLTFTSIEKGINQLFIYYSNKIKDIKKEDILFD